MTPQDVARLACPACRGPLDFDGTLAGEHIERGRLRCAGCGRPWPVSDGFPDLVDEAQVRGLDWVMRFVYDRIAPLHDPATYVLLPLLQGSSEASTREGSMRRLRLGDLTVVDGRRPSVLEVNSMPAWAGVQKVTQPNIAATLAADLIAALDRNSMQQALS